MLNFDDTRNEFVRINMAIGVWKRRCTASIPEFAQNSQRTQDAIIAIRDTLKYHDCMPIKDDNSMLEFFAYTEEEQALGHQTLQLAFK